MSFLGGVAEQLARDAALSAGKKLLGRFGLKKGGRPRQRKADGGKILSAGMAVKEALPELVALAKMAKSAVGLKKGGRPRKRKARGGRM